MRIKQEERPPPRTGSSRDKWQRTPGTGTSGAEQAAGAATLRTGASRDKWRKTPRIGSSGAKQEGEATAPGPIRAGKKGPDAQGTKVRGGSSRSSPRHRDWSGSNTKDHTREEHRSRAEEEAGEMPSSGDVAGPRGSGEADQRRRPRGCREMEMRTRPSVQEEEGEEKPRGSQDEEPEEKQ